MTTDLDVTNKWAVGEGTDTVRILRSSAAQVLTPTEALVLAAYLVSIAEPMSDHRFDDVLAAVQST